MLVREALEVLGLAADATPAEIKAAHRDLVKVWHPDRFGSDARLRAKAEEKLKQINQAYMVLRSDSGEAAGSGGSPAAATPGWLARDINSGALGGALAGGSSAGYPRVRCPQGRKEAAEFRNAGTVGGGPGAGRAVGTVSPGVECGFWTAEASGYGAISRDGVVGDADCATG